MYRCFELLGWVEFLPYSVYSKNKEEWEIVGIKKDLIIGGYWDILVNVKTGEYRFSDLEGWEEV